MKNTGDIIRNILNLEKKGEVDVVIVYILVRNKKTGEFALVDLKHK